MFTGIKVIFLMGLQVGKHGLIIEFTDPDYNVRRSATYLPEVAAHEGEYLTAKFSILQFCSSISV